MAVPKQWKDFDRLLWAERHWDEFPLYVVQQLAFDLWSAIKSNSKGSATVHLIRVKVGQDEFFGVSLEPKAYQMALEEAVELAQVLVAVTDSENSLHRALVERGPWRPDRLPAIFATKEEGFFFVRDAPKNERIEVAIRNQVVLEDMGRKAVDLSERTWFLTDLRYNMARGEFGIGDKQKPLWRPAMRALVKDHLPQVAKDVRRAFFDGKFPEQPPTFETRSPDWLDANADFAMMIIKTSRV